MRALRCSAAPSSWTTWTPNLSAGPPAPPPGGSRVKNARRAQELLTAEPDGWMATLGARIAESEPGRVVLELVAGPQHRHGGGVVQGGVITQIADAAMGMSLATLQEDGLWNTTIELKINFLRPVVAGRLRAVGRVIEMKQTLMFSEADVLDDQGRIVARASSTCMAVPQGQGRE
jgi:uncharacterized protein (TIGR00369 family)